jgi:hypothetical protein
MNKGYIWNNGTVGLAFVSRSGTQILFKEIVSKYEPESTSEFVISDTEWKPASALESIKDLNSLNISGLDFAVIVRDPVERFRSSCVKLNYSVEQALNDLENVHLISLKNMGFLDSNNPKYFAYSNEGLASCSSYIGLDNSPSLVEEDENKKPVLTQEQIDLIKAAYSHDYEVFSNL